jgi:poly-beta-1,6-N-acetyl-D-glucosamine synthase
VEPITAAAYAGYRSSLNPDVPVTTLVTNICLILTVVVFAYPFLLYPGLLAIIAARFPYRPIRPSTEAIPTVALIVCALNEEKIIREKLENSLQLDYPEGKLRTIFVSDGSSDSTASIIREYGATGIVLIEKSVRRGKIQNLNELIPTIEEDVIVLSDANVMYHPGAIRELVRPLADPSVGCTSGKVVLFSTAAALDGGTNDYYSMEWQLQANASRVLSMVGADGAMYAFRRELFRPCPPDTVIEDFVIPMQILRQGKRVVFQPTATGWEQGTTSIREEFKRKIRIAAGAMQSLLRGNGWPANCSWRAWFIFFSHKLLRWISPVLGMCALMLAVLTNRNPLSILIVGSCLFLGICAAASLTIKHNSRILDAAFYFLLGQVAIAIGLFKGLMGRQSVLWAKADR